MMEDSAEKRAGDSKAMADKAMFALLEKQTGPGAAAELQDNSAASTPPG